jgi:hypothetical protein
MDYKYIEQLMERYWNAETTLEEENILRTFFSQKNIPAEMEQWRPLFTCTQEESLGDDFDVRMLEMIDNSVKAREVSLTQRLMPLFKAAAVVAIILTLGNAAQAPWDAAWDDPRDYARNMHDVDTVAAIIPVQAENLGDGVVDTTKVLMPLPSKD